MKGKRIGVHPTTVIGLVGQGIVSHRKGVANAPPRAYIDLTKAAASGATTSAQDRMENTTAIRDIGPIDDSRIHRLCS